MALKKKQSSSRRNYMLPLVAGVVILAFVSTFLTLHIRKVDDHKAAAKTDTRSNSVNYTPSTPGDNAANDNRKANTTPSQTLNDQPSAPTNSSLSATIVNASVNSGNIHVGTMVGGTTSGTCALTATQGSQHVTLASANIQQDVNSYDCGVFNVSTTQFPSTGDWKITLTVTSDGQQANDSTSITIPNGS